jgi:hypothetical protein
MAQARPALSNQRVASAECDTNAIEFLCPSFRRNEPAGNVGQLFGMNSFRLSAVLLIGLGFTNLSQSADTGLDFPSNGDAPPTHSSHFSF